MDAVFEELRGDRLVTLRERFQRVGIEGIVEAEDAAVDAFPGVLFSGMGHQRQQCQGNAGERASDALNPASTEVAHERCLLEKFLWRPATSGRAV